MSTTSEWVRPRERVLGKLTLVLGLLVWLGLLVGTLGALLIALLLGFVLYVFAQSAFIAYIKGHSVELTAQQFPDLHAQFTECCDKLGMRTPPRAYVLHGGGALNAFATQFLGHQYVVLLSGVVDAMAQHPDGVRFYIGHELGHLRMKHLTGVLLRLPVLWLPLLGAAYARSRETTCDLHGLACSSSPENAARALAALAAGSERWRDLDVQAYVDQARESSGFWMSFHELTAGYPWLTKRVARVAGHSVPGRQPLAYVLALFVPYAGPLGGGFGLIVMVYLIGVLAAVAIPQYKTYVTKAKLSAAAEAAAPARKQLLQAYTKTGQVPETLAAAGLPEQGPDGSAWSLNSEGMVLRVKTSEGALVFTPLRQKDDSIAWHCEGVAPLTAAVLPPGCQVAEANDE